MLYGVLLVYKNSAQGVRDICLFRNDLSALLFNFPIITTRFCLRHIPTVNFQAGMSYADAPIDRGRPLEVSL